MFGRKKKQEPPVTKVDGLHVQAIDRYTKLRREYIIDYREFIEQVLKQDGGHIEKIDVDAFTGKITIFWYKLVRHD